MTRQPDNITQHETEPLSRWHGGGGNHDADPMELEAWQAARMTEDLRAFIAARYPEARSMVVCGALAALAVEYGRGAGVEAKGFVDAVKRTFAPLPGKWKRLVEAGSVFAVSPTLPSRAHLSASVAQAQPVKCSNGMEFDSLGQAAEWARANGYPKARHQNIGRAIGDGGRAYGFTWTRADTDAVAA